MANSENQVELKLGLDISGVQEALYGMIEGFNGTGKEFDKITKNIQNSFKNLEATIKRFGADSDEAAAAAKRYSNSLTALVANGVNPASNEFKKLSSAVVGANNSLSSSGDTLRKDNRMWTNLALVVQDLPFGFRGIQNNLPALMSGIAGLTGPIYLLGSAIIALFTYWTNGSSKAEESTNRLTEALKRNNDVVEKGAEGQSKALVEMSKMSVIFTGVKDGTIRAEDALKKYNQTYGDTFGIAKSVNEAEDIFIKKTGDYVKASALRAMANEKYAQAQEEFKKGRLASGKDNVTFLEKMASAMDALDQVGIMGQDPTALFSFFSKFSKNYAAVQKQATTDIVNASASAFDLFMAEAANLEREANKYMTDLGLKGGSESAKKLEDNYIEVLRALQRFHKDNIWEYAKYEKEILTRQERLAVAQAALEGKSQEYISNIRKKYQLDRMSVDKELGDKWLKQQEDIYEEQRRIIERTNQLVAENARNMGKAINKIHDNFSDERLKTIKLETDTALKLHKGFRKAQIRDLKEEKKKLEAEKLGEFITPEQSRKIDDLLAQNAAKLKVYEDEWTKVAENINSTINSLIGDSIALLGEHIGNLMTGDAIEGIQKFEQLLAAALINIGKMLIQYGVALEIALANPDPLVAIAAGIAAVAIGTAIKNASAKNNATGPTKFANGGIISGPTYGLMGEYPGAKNNPEVVAPLDKLKEMMGSGEGQFVLRGQDLILAINRSKESLTLRRG